MSQLKKRQIHIEKIATDDLLINPLLHQALWQIAAPSYVDPTAVLARDLAQCEKIYLAKNSDNQLFAFFMVGWQELIVEELVVPTVYLGLSATSNETKGTGIGRLLFNEFFEDARKWEQLNQQKLVLWHTTATPSIFHAFNVLLKHNEPFSDGSYSDESSKIANAIRKKKGWSNETSEHPFVLKGIAENTLYSNEEHLRLNKICKEKNFNLFSELNINERQGDRLLRISYL